MSKSPTGDPLLSHSLGSWVLLNWICPCSMTAPWASCMVGLSAWWACQHGEPASCGPGSMHLRQMKASGEASMSFDRSPVFLLITSYCWRQTSWGLFVCVD